MKTKKLSLSPKALIALALGATLTTFAGNTKAAILFDNGAAPSEIIAGYYADAGNTPGSGNGFFEAGNVITPSASGTANVIDFAGWYYNGGIPVGSLPTDDFTISLYSVTGGAPDALLSSSTLSGLSSTSLGVSTGAWNGFESYEYSGVLNTPFALDTSSSYYLGISDLTTPYSNFVLDVAAVTGPSTTGYSLNTDGTFGSYTDSLSFDLKAVPEPTTYALCGLSALVLILAYRRKQAA